MLTAAANPAAAHTSQKIASCLNAAAVSKLGKMHSHAACQAR